MIFFALLELQGEQCLLGRISIKATSFCGTKEFHWMPRKQRSGKRGRSLSSDTSSSGWGKSGGNYFSLKFLFKGSRVTLSQILKQNPG